jgi:hypothetical protein
MTKTNHSMCSKCSKLICKTDLQAENDPLSEAPDYCPMKLWPGLLDEALEEYKKEGNFGVFFPVSLDREIYLLEKARCCLVIIRTSFTHNKVMTKAYGNKIWKNKR